jgi:predicted RNA binding protein YcfA (HicA-like mRNA interferase family)
MADTGKLNAIPTTAETELPEINATLGEGDNIVVQSASTIRLTQRHYEAFLAIFDYSSRNEARRLKWKDFINAMTYVGFAEETSKGSVRKLKPPAGWDVTPLTIHQPHKPHTNGNLEKKQKSDLKKKLGDAYGWDMSTFVVE